MYLCHTQSLSRADTETPIAEPVTAINAENGEQSASAEAITQPVTALSAR